MKYYTEPYRPDMRRWEPMCVQCWAIWEDELGDCPLASAMVIAKQPNGMG